MVSKGKFSLKSLGDVVQSIEQDFLRSFIRQNVTGPIAGQLSGFLGGASGATGNSSGGIFGSLFSSIGAWFHHRGGEVGNGSAPHRQVSAYLFAGAPRFHNGLMAAYTYRYHGDGLYRSHR